ncbi:MAG: AAA family ATPase [Chloroflexota bacterium]|nr:AAA family ATPase [Chloroflexota bacterium]
MTTSAAANLTLGLPLPAFEAGAAADVLGTLVAVHFRDERGFAIFSLEQRDGSRVRALGHLPPDITLRAVVRLGGTWMRHAQHGWQVRVNTFELVDHLDRRGVVAFLVAYTKHLGPVRAAEAVKRFGDRVFEVLRETPEALCAIKGITPDRARAIHQSFGQVASIADIDSWLRHLGLGRADARRVREAYGNDAARLVRENPYRLADDIHGIGFLTADSLRLMLGIAPTSTFRLHAALKYVLSVVAHGEGHVYLPLAELVDRTARQLDERRAATGAWEPDPELVAAIGAYIPRFAESEDGHAELIAAPADAPATPEDAHIYARVLYDAECEAATRLAQLLHQESRLFEPDELESAIAQAETLHQIVLESDQRRAIATALSSPVSIISGGPGVGKTTSVRVLVALLEQRGVSYMLLSPTGKAAKRLAEATLRDAYTIHRQLFSLDRRRGQIDRNTSGAEVYLPVDAVIVDEASMVDLPLLAWLLRSVQPGARLIFVGDKDQLASIGPGSVLRDLIACGRIPVTLLTVIKRQGEGSPIVEAAHGINHGQLPVAGSNATGDLYILRARAPSEDQGVHAQQLVVESAVRLNAQVLTPQHTSPVGVTALNRALQARLNPGQPSKAEVQLGNDVVFRLGDRLIVGKNNYQTLCFNGETGQIVDIGPERLTLRMDDVDGERLVDYERDEWWQLQLAYAITTHRAQGSEWDNVVVVVSQSHYMMLQRNLLYTALTRARKRAVIVVSGGLQNRQTGRIYKSALEVAVANDRIARRYSGLAERVAQSG